jgi:hypothetical protein
VPGFRPDLQCSGANFKFEFLAVAQTAMSMFRNMRWMLLALTLMAGDTSSEQDSWLPPPQPVANQPLVT